MKYFKKIKGQLTLEPIPVEEPVFPPQIDPATLEEEMGKWLFLQILICNHEGSILVGVSEEEAANYVHPQVEETTCGLIGRN